MAEVYVGLGSNVRPEQHLPEAIEHLQRQFGALRCSHCYQSPAYGFVGADFLNAVVAFESALAPAAIEAVLSAVEYAEGRPRAARRFGSRTLDLDLLLYGARVDPTARLPRADVLQYPFVLAPLVELAPRLLHPVTGVSIDAAWRAMAASRPPLDCRGPLDALA
jgi:2-amino-4-hydroxy-6-hydroxymethyldihydropteridine diphosphokinase